MRPRGKVVWALLTLVWSVGLGAVMQHSQGAVVFAGWAVGEMIVTGVCVFGVTGRSWLVPEPRHGHHHDHCDLEREQQEHLWDQARLAYLTNPNSQQPPPTDNYRGF